jgi:hypothetical protein
MDNKQNTGKDPTTKNSNIPGREATKLTDGDYIMWLSKLT